MPDDDPFSEDQNQFPSRIGKGMVIAAWIFVLAFLAVFFDSALERQTNPNRQVEGSITGDGVAEVSLRRNRAGHYVANGQINGEEVVFLLDTGATDIALSARLADHLGLKRGRRLVARTANGNVLSYSTMLDEVRLGSIVLRRVRAAILPNMQGQVLLGMSFLKRLEMVQKGNVLTLRQY